MKLLVYTKRGWLLRSLIGMSWIRDIAIINCTNGDGYLVKDGMVTIDDILFLGTPHLTIELDQAFMPEAFLFQTITNQEFLSRLITGIGKYTLEEVVDTLLWREDGPT